MSERQKAYRTSKAEQALRWEYGQGKMSLATFNRRYEKLKKAGQILRSGRIIS